LQKCRTSSYPDFQKAPARPEPAPSTPMLRERHPDGPDLRARPGLQGHGGMYLLERKEVVSVPFVISAALVPTSRMCCAFSLMKSVSQCLMRFTSLGLVL
jgi:hypothetical protein